MSTFTAALRLTIIFLDLLFGTILVVLLSFVPLKVRGSSLAGWMTTYMARLFLWAAGIRLECRERRRFLAHRGFVFPNHDSYLDIVIPISLRPMRFLAMVEIEEMWFIGRIARSIGTIFVERKSKDSRQQARDQLAKVDLFPPIFLFPEGGIDGDPDLQPFRYGAFELAIENEIPFMPAVILYEPFEVAKWGDESMGAALWRVLKFGRLQARLVAFRTVHPQPDDNPRELALAAQGTISATLTAHQRGSETVIRSGL